MMTPPFNIWARPALTVKSLEVPFWAIIAIWNEGEERREEKGGGGK
jgi:hypothetical protein